jgi:hypothetical protein
MKKNQHVVPREGGWGVVGAGNSKATKVHDTQKKAADHAREVARKSGSEVVIHGRDGKIRDSNSYGNDPFPPKG